jgi:hypothetical protein
MGQSSYQASLQTGKTIALFINDLECRLLATPENSGDGRCNSLHLIDKMAARRGFPPIYCKLELALATRTFAGADCSSISAAKARFSACASTKRNS